MGLQIGLDIDGVVADSFTVFRQELNKHYGKDIVSIDHYDMTKVYDVPWDNLSRFFDDHMEYLFSASKPMAGAVQSVHALLQAGHAITYITARKSGEEERVTLKWFETQGIPVQRAVFTGSTSKTHAIKKFGIELFVEDFLTNALEIVEMGIPVLLLDAPYNQGKLPHGVVRCCNWHEIMQFITEYDAGKRCLAADSPKD